VIKVKDAALYIGVKPAQMRSLENSKMLIPAIRSPAGRRYYTMEQLTEFKEKVLKKAEQAAATEAYISAAEAKANITPLVKTPPPKLVIPAVASAITKTTASTPVITPVVLSKHERGAPTTLESVQQLKDLIAKRRKMEPFNKESLDWSNWYEDVEYWENKLETEEAVLKEMQTDAAKEPELK
jgi:DNA-binding transcriptional MerR regulator